jgi:predicted regulator of Ras-like GTPase activity (Roadblock/LC7/MglB family)
MGRTGPGSSRARGPTHGGQHRKGTALSDHLDHLDSRAERLAAALDDFIRSSPDVEAAAVVSFDGLPMASALPDDLEEDRVGAMSAALLSLGEQAALGLGRGQLNQVFVEGEHGFVFLMSARDQAVLAAIAARTAKIGFMLFEMRRAADRIGRALESPAVPTTPPPAVAPPVEAPGASHDGHEPNGHGGDGHGWNGHEVQHAETNGHAEHDHADASVHADGALDGYHGHDEGHDHGHHEAYGDDHAPSAPPPFDHGHDHEGSHDAPMFEDRADLSPASSDAWND